MKKNCLFLLISFFLSVSHSFASGFKREVIVIVDGISTGKYLAPLFRESGYDVVHVSSALGKKLNISFKEQDYSRAFEESAMLVEQIKGLDKIVKAIVPGCESGVDLAEKLQRDFDLPHNDFDPSYSPRNKFYMQEKLRQAGLPAINQILTHDYQELLKWVGTQSYPIILKPVESTGTDSVYICFNEKELKKYFYKVLGSKNAFKEKNEDVLCQEYISGLEFAVNTISKKGKSVVVEVLFYDKEIKNNSPMYSFSTLTSCQHKEFPHISAYIKSAYSALGIREGASHVELKVTERNGEKIIYLIEIAPRLSGTASPAAINEVQGVTQTSLLVDSIIHPQRFEAISREAILPRKSLAQIFLYSPLAGILKKEPGPHNFSHLKTFYQLHFYYKEGRTLPITTDITNFPGYVYLVGSQKEIEADIKNIRKIEKTLYADILN